MSKHKVYTLYIIVGVTMLLAACTMPAKQQTVGNKAGHQFTNEVLLGYTPVKNQGRNPLCWAYSMLATYNDGRLGKLVSRLRSTQYAYGTNPTPLFG